MNRRFLTPFRVLAAGAVVVLSACGTASGTQSGATVVNLGTTNWATIPTVPPTVATIPGTTLPPTPGSQTTTITPYTLKDGDNPTKVASFYGITLQELNDVNAGTTGYDLFFIGLIIKIPVGATIPEVGAAPGATVPTVAAEICGEYTLLAGDFPKVVADKFRVTVKALDAANEDTNGYGGFIVGTKIQIPCAQESASG